MFSRFRASSLSKPSGSPPTESPPSDIQSSSDLKSVEITNIDGSILPDAFSNFERNQVTSASEIHGVQHKGKYGKFTANQPSHRSDCNERENGNGNGNVNGNDFPTRLNNKSNEYKLLKQKYANMEDLDIIKERMARNRARLETLEYDLPYNVSSLKITSAYERPAQICNSKVEVKSNSNNSTTSIYPLLNANSTASDHYTRAPINDYRNITPSPGPQRNLRPQGQQPSPLPKLSFESPTHQPQEATTIQGVLEMEVETFRALHYRDILGVLASRLSKEFINLYGFVQDISETNFLPYSEPFASPSVSSPAAQRIKRAHIDSLDSACLTLRDFLHEICQRDLKLSPMLSKSDPDVINRGLGLDVSPVMIKTPNGQTGKSPFADDYKTRRYGNTHYYSSPSVDGQVSTPTRVVKSASKHMPQFSQDRRILGSHISTPLLPKFNLPAGSSSESMSSCSDPIMRKSGPIIRKTPEMMPYSEKEFQYSIPASWNSGGDVYEYNYGHKDSHGSRYGDGGYCQQNGDPYRLNRMTSPLKMDLSASRLKEPHKSKYK